ncbi:MAG: hypothetical protein HZB53_09460 [Chloroflexi bacterium]|nr:hypothetical protein [Chloroflexota bacterium]
MSEDYILSMRVQELERQVAFLMAELGLKDKYAGQAPTQPADDDVVALARSKGLIEAIKLYRQKHGVGLAEAKAAVEALLTAR